MQNGTTTGTAPAPASPDSRDTQFRAVEGGSSEVASGSTLLVEAYAAVWIILLGFLLASWRRQSRIDARVAELERAVAAARGGAK
jgi:CcmD family protein